MTRTAPVLIVAGLAAAGVAACRGAESGPLRASGYVEATEVRVAAEVGGRVLQIEVEEGDRVRAGSPIATIDTSDVELAIARADAERAHAAAQLDLLRAGARPEDVRQAAAQAQTARAEIPAAQAELDAAAADLARFQALLDANAGSRKAREDAATRHDVAAARLGAARERARAAAEALARVRAGARPQELAAAQARLAAADAQIATLRKAAADARVVSPVGGTVTARLADAGELVVPRTPIAVVTDLDRVWANVYVDGPVVPRLKVGLPLTLVTDAGARLEGRITFISPEAEFTPRNVQTAEERTRLVYRIKVTVDNREGILKAGMPVDAEMPR